ncbi:MAG: hypothetical protein JO020_00935, partial [Chloroflexi bacterium]|nr:hypothetical protein [Chloroflexota bacterium]
MASLHEIERYYDGVPRSIARAEEIGPFTLFVNTRSGWPYYARPSLGAQSFRVEDILRVRARQRQLQVPESFEWVAETTPALAAVAEAAGLSVGRHPLMVLDHDRSLEPPPPLQEDDRRTAHSPLLQGDRSLESPQSPQSPQSP